MLLSNDEKYETSLTGDKANHSESMLKHCNSINFVVFHKELFVGKIMSFVGKFAGFCWHCPDARSPSH